jgi:hypothetical protein
MGADAFDFEVDILDNGKSMSNSACNCARMSPPR